MAEAQPRALPEEQKGLSLKWKVMISVVFGIFMVILDTTVVNVAFQTMRSEFQASLNDSQWIISIYVLSLGISTPLAGFLSDRYGLKKVYLSGLAIFAVGSLICGISPNLTVLIAARAFQGFGGGIALPLAGQSCQIGRFHGRFCSVAQSLSTSTGFGWRFIKLARNCPRGRPSTRRCLRKPHAFIIVPP